MPWLRRVALIASLAVMASSSGCCLFSNCAGGGMGGGIAGQGNALESYYQGGCDVPGCADCGDSRVLPHDGPVPGYGLGLGCIGKLLGMSHGPYVGCGETYYHSWVNDPPSCDPCDGYGNWTGIQAAAGCGCGGVGCNQCELGAMTGCGLANCNACGAAGRGRPLFRIPGRTIYATWTGVVGLVHGLHGFFPTCHHCNSFSLTSACGDCTVVPSCGCASPSPDCGCVGVVDSQCGCGVGSDCPSCTQSTGLPQDVMAQTTGKLPHAIVRAEMKMNHGRPPHQVLSNRMLQYRR